MRGLLVLFQRYGEGGRQALTKQMFHEVDEERKIWQFSKGDIRAIGFIESGRFFIVSTVALKKGQSVDKKAVDQAANLRDSMFPKSSHGNPSPDKLSAAMALAMQDLQRK